MITLLRTTLGCLCHTRFLEAPEPPIVCSEPMLGHKVRRRAAYRVPEAAHGGDAILACGPASGSHLEGRIAFGTIPPAHPCDINGQIVAHS